MIDFNSFELVKFSKLLETISGYTDNNLRYPKAGELVEKALAEYSNKQLQRVNLPGIDLITPKGISYESKITQFSMVRKSQGRNSRFDSLNKWVKDPEQEFTS